MYWPRQATGWPRSERLEVLDQRAPVRVGANPRPEVVAAVRASGPRGVEPVARIAEAPKELPLAEPSERRIAREGLANARPIERASRRDLEDLRARGRRPEQIVERRHAAVVQVGKVGPDTGQRRRRVAAALDERPFARQRAAVEGGDESRGHHLEARPI